MVIGDRRGIAIAFPLFLVILLACSALVLDIGRAHMVRAKLQLISDASSLAGAMTADVVVPIEYVTEYVPREKAEDEFDEQEDGQIEGQDDGQVDDQGDEQDGEQEPEEPEYDIVIREIRGTPYAIINDYQKANISAQKAEQANGGISNFWSSVMGDYSSKKPGQYLSWGETGWAGRVAGDVTYYTETRVKLAPGYLKFLGSDGMEVYTNSTAEAYIENE